MSGLVSAINTALTGIEAYETGIGAVSQNLTNQTTAGYAVETVNLATAQEGTGQAGSGVQAAQITRAADGFAAGLLRTANSASQGASVLSPALTNISNALLNNGDVQSAINQFFQDVSTLASNPGNATAQTVLSDAQSVAGSFQSASASLTSTMTGAATTLQQNVGTANTLLGQLATINQNLQTSPNDPSLLDQQEADLQSLSGLLPVSVLPQEDGQVMINSGGSSLLNQNGAQTLTLSGGTGSTPPSVTAGTFAVPLSLGENDGSIGANIQTWQSGAQASQGLNALASIFAANVNTTQAEGLTSSGSPGEALFSVPAPSVTAAGGNTGSATLTAQLTNSSQLPTSGGPFQVTYTAAAGWTATDQSSGNSYALGPPGTASLNFAGLTVAVSGTPANGDQFTVDPAPGAASAISVAATSPDDIAAADPYVATAGTLQSDGSIADDNAGSTVIGADTVTSTPAAGSAQIPASYFGQTLQVTFTSPTSYSVASVANPGTTIATGSFSGGSGSIAVAYPAGAAAGSYWQLPLSGTPASGDVITISPGGSSSGSNASRMAALWTATGGTSAGTLQQAVVGFSSELGANAQQAQLQATASASQVTAATTNLQSISGVSSDQQAVLLTNYQQAYQAAAQVISTAHGMFESLLQAI